MKRLTPYIDFGLLSASVLGYYALQNLVPRTDFTSVLVLYSLLFAAYAYWSFVRKPTFKQIVFAGLLFRLCMLTGSPNWSNDYYRFFWDAEMSLAGINPYAFTPNELQIEYPQVFEQHAALYQELNSPDYYSVYPPVLQGLFVAAAWVGGHQVYGFVKVTQILIVLAELLTVLLMASLLSFLKKRRNLSAIYFLNPLIILELTGNMHNEVFMVLFVVLSLWLLHHQRWLWAAATLAVAVACKLYPLLLAPLFFIKAKENNFRFAIGFALSMALIFLPLIGWQELMHIKASVDLYFQKFEFNGGIYFLLRKVVTYFTQFNPIEFLGPALGLVFLLLTTKVYYRFFQNRTRLSLFALVGLVVFLFYATSTTVHPWYMSLMIAMSVFTPWRFAIVWSFLIILTYYTYSSVPYHESYLMVAIGWIGMLGYLIWETIAYRKELSNELPK